MERRLPSNKKNSGPRPPSQRQLRVGEQLRHVLASVFQKGEIKDPFFDRSDAGLTITEVRCSNDLRNATAYFVPLGGGDNTELAEALTRAAPLLQKIIGRQLTLKFTPRISFKRDRAFEEANHINSLLNSPRVRRDWDGPATEPETADDEN